MTTYATRLNEQYAPTDILARIVDRLRMAGKDLATITRDELAPLDEFHSGGRESTRELARLAAFRPGSSLLDIGSGVGGPARTLAAEFGAVVTGIDITAEYCRAAEMLTHHVGLSDKVGFHCGNALDMPFPDASFDVVWTQNTLMNIEDKAALFHQIYRVLRPGGLVAIEVILAGEVPELHFPAPWANSSSLSFLIPAGELKRQLAAAGLREKSWEDTTARTLMG